MNRKFVCVFTILVIISGGIFVYSCNNSNPSASPDAAGVKLLPPDDSESFYKFDEPPVLLMEVKTIYPEEAKQSGREGTVMVKVLVGLDGKVKGAVVLESSDEIFENAAINAALQCKFKPAKYKGSLTKSYVAIPFQFHID